MLEVIKHYWIWKADLIYRFWLAPWYLQTLLIYYIKYAIAYFNSLSRVKISALKQKQKYIVLVEKLEWIYHSNQSSHVCLADYSIFNCYTFVLHFEDTPEHNFKAIPLEFNI